MKFYSTTFDDKERTLEINELLGKRFSLLQSIKMGGTGSSRMMVEEVSPSFSRVMNKISNVNYSSIEIRPKGIIVHFVQQGLKSWCWVIPYYKLVIYHADGLRIHADGNFVAYKNDRHLDKNQPFIQKTLKLKQEFLSATEFPI